MGNKAARFVAQSLFEKPKNNMVCRKKTTKIAGLNRLAKGFFTGELE